jgi:hypothetical protein
MLRNFLRDKFAAEMHRGIHAQACLPIHLDLGTGPQVVAISRRQ